MSGYINVDVLGEDEVKRARELLAGIPNGAHRALGAAIRRGASYLRTNSAKVIQERYDISTANIRANENVTIRYMGQGAVDATVRFAGGKIPLFRYGGASPGAPAFYKDRRVFIMMEKRVKDKWQMFHPGLPAHGHVFKATRPYRFEGAFVAQMKSGHVGIFERHDDWSRTITEVMGLSVAQMVGNDQVKQKLTEDTAEKVAERYHHEVIRLLNGWGG